MAFIEVNAAAAMYHTSMRRKISTAWVSGTAYNADALVDGDYRCILAHTAEAANEPGVGASWATYWELYNDMYYYVRHGWWAVGCDASRIVEAKIENTGLDFFLVGYATEDIFVPKGGIAIGPSMIF